MHSQLSSSKVTSQLSHRDEQQAETVGESMADSRRAASLLGGIWILTLAPAVWGWGRGYSGDSLDKSEPFFLFCEIRKIGELLLECKILINVRYGCVCVHMYAHKISPKINVSVFTNAVFTGTLQNITPRNKENLLYISLCIYIYIYLECLP